MELLILVVFIFTKPDSWHDHDTFYFLQTFVKHLLIIQRYFNVTDLHHSYWLAYIYVHNVSLLSNLNSVLSLNSEQINAEPGTAQFSFQAGKIILFLSRDCLSLYAINIGRAFRLHFPPDLLINVTC